MIGWKTAFLNFSRKLRTCESIVRSSIETLNPHTLSINCSLEKLYFDIQEITPSLKILSVLKQSLPAENAIQRLLI